MADGDTLSASKVYLQSKHNPGEKIELGELSLNKNSNTASFTISKAQIANKEINDYELKYENLKSFDINGNENDNVANTAPTLAVDTIAPELALKLVPSLSSVDKDTQSLTFNLVGQNGEALRDMLGSNHLSPNPSITFNGKTYQIQNGQVSIALADLQALKGTSAQATISPEVKIYDENGNEGTLSTLSTPKFIPNDATPDKLDVAQKDSFKLVIDGREIAITDVSINANSWSGKASLSADDVADIGQGAKQLLGIKASDASGAVVNGSTDKGAETLSIDTQDAQISLEIDGAKITKTIDSNGDISSGTPSGKQTLQNSAIISINNPNAKVWFKISDESLSQDKIKELLTNDKNLSYDKDKQAFSYDVSKLKRGKNEIKISIDDGLNYKISKTFILDYDTNAPKVPKLSYDPLGNASINLNGDVKPGIGSKAWLTYKNESGEISQIEFNFAKDGHCRRCWKYKQPELRWAG